MIGKIAWAALFLGALACPRAGQEKKAGEEPALSRPFKTV